MKLYFKIVCYLFVVLAIGAARAGSLEEFFHAIGLDDERKVGALLERGFDPNTVDAKGQVGLFLALREESDKVVKRLLAHPAIKLDAANASLETPLMMAALRGRMDWTRQLLDRGAAIERPGWNALHYAASGPESKVVALLLDRGAAIDALAPNGTTALMMAARYGSDDSARLLLARGAAARLKNQAGLQAADFARTAGRDNLAERLEQAVR